jgi:CoA:oxalate CoA-transferase
MYLPLKGLIVLEFCQYLSGPSAGLRLADLGARVIKIERPKTGDAGRKLAIKDMWAGEDSLLFHTVNRNKESFTANLKDKAELNLVKKLIQKADVLIHNFRPGVMEKTGLGYEVVKELNPRIIYSAISGYGKEGPWKNKPGQDLLVQSIAGLAFTTGNATNGPIPFGIAIADILSGAQLVQGILAALIRRHKTGAGALIEISLLESLLDFQFELLTTYFTTAAQPKRSMVSNGHPLLSAPYGIYATKDGYLALAMIDIYELADAIDCYQLKEIDKENTFSERDEIKTILSRHLSAGSTAYWMDRLQEKGFWAMEVFNWEKMMGQEAYRCLKMEQSVRLKEKEIITTRCPIRINGKRIFSANAAPALGEHNDDIYKEIINRN